MTPISKNNLYLILAIIFLTVSVIGVYRLYSHLSPATLTDDTTPIPTSSRAYTDQSDYDYDSPTLAPTSVISMDEVEPTPAHLQYTGDTFKVTYPSYRQLTIENESFGKRYVFYSSKGNITLHAGTSWSWSHPGRTFSTDLTIASQPTFRYDTTTQTIVDFQVDDLKYTIQCVHNANSDLQSECDQFIANFQFSSQ